MTDDAIKPAPEADITVNGHRLTTAQSMTVRVALGNFAMTLREQGEPQPGSIESSYLQRISEVMRAMA